MADAFNLSQMGNLPPELYEQQQALNRQQQMAQLLMQQGQKQPQAQMIGNRYVAPSIFQNLQPIASMLAGAYIGKQGDEKALELATKLREGRLGTQQAITEALNAGDTKKALSIATADQYGAGKEFIPALIANVIPKAAAPTTEMQNYNFAKTPEGGEFKGTFGQFQKEQANLKNFAPHASQLVPVQGGFAEYNPNTKTFTPIGGGQGGAAGTPAGALTPPLPSHLQSEVSSINQQKSSINDALKTVEANKDAFGPKFAAPGLLLGEYGTAKMNEKLSSSQVEARAKVFNIASSVIKERAGTAQSKQEQTVIMRFLPSPYDGEKAISDKFRAFNDYLDSKEKGINPVIGSVPSYRPGATQTPAATKGGLPAGVTKEQWNVMTPDEKAAFK